MGLFIACLFALSLASTAAFAGAPHGRAPPSNKAGATAPRAVTRSGSGCVTGGFATCGGFVGPSPKPTAPSGTPVNRDGTGNDGPGPKPGAPPR